MRGRDGEETSPADYNCLVQTPLNMVSSTYLFCDLAGPHQHLQECRARRRCLLPSERHLCAMYSVFSMRFGQAAQILPQQRQRLRRL